MARSKAAKRARPETSAAADSAAVGSPIDARLAAGLVIVALFAGFVHAPALDAQAHCFDENEFLVSNPLVSNPSWASVGRFVTEVIEPTTVAGYYAPLTMISLMLDVALGGTPEDLTAFHRTNLLLHALNGVLLAFFLARLLGHPIAAIAAALLFVAHPLSVEPVAWIVERKTLLASFFSLLAGIAYLRSLRDAEAGRDRGASRTLTAAAFTLACLAKPTAVVLPALLLVLDYWPLERLRLDALRERLMEKLELFVLAAVFAAITLVSHERTAGIEAAAEDGLAPLYTAGHLVAFYLGKLVWPTALSPVYLLPDPLSPSNPRVAIGLLVCVALAVGAVALARRGIRAPLAGLAILVLGLAPTLGGLKYSWVTASDKYVYLPGIGIALLMAWGIARAWKWSETRPAAIRIGILGLIAALLAGETWASRQQLAHWRSTETLYEHMLALTPDVALLHANLGQRHWQQGRVEPAREAMERAIELDPNDAQAHNNLGVLYWSTQRPQRALHHLEAAVAADPTLSAPHRNRGIALNGFGRFEAARQSFERSLAIEDDDPQTHCGLALALGRLNQLALAREHYVRSLALAPGCALPPGLLP